MVAAGTPPAERVFGEGHFLRPNFIQPYRCTNVLIGGITLINSPMWEVHPELCTNVTMWKVTARTLEPNNDGRRIGVPSENLVIRDSVFRGATAPPDLRGGDVRLMGVTIERGK